MSKIIEPYEHDCDTCKWVGWHACKDKLGNIYICEPGNGRTRSIIIRWSSEPGDYQSYPIGESVKGSISVDPSLLASSSRG